MADAQVKFGRKRAILLSLLFQFVTSLGVYLTPTFSVMIALKSVSGIATHSLFAIGATMGIELVGPSKRTFTGIVVEFFWAAGVLLALPIAYITRDWRYTQLTICLLTVPLFSLWWLIPESPRWLLSQRRYAEAEQLIERVCKSNKTKMPQGALDEDTASDGPKDRLIALFSNRVLICRTLVIFFNWLAVNLLYYGLSLGTENLSGSTYVNYLLGIGLEIFGYTLAFFLVDKVGRRRLHCFCMLVSGAACLGTALPSRLGGAEYEWMVTGLALTGRMFSSAAYAILYVMSAELFPTVVRNSAIGVCCVFESLGGITSPYIADLGLLVGGPFSHSLPMLVFGCVSVMAGFLSLSLPETLHKPLPETIQDAIDFDKPLKSSLPSNGLLPPVLDCNSRTPLSSSEV
ncbi:organic cation transporter protein [Plakobranchus ocellatus]|uniref:Organic cation transporter protein n=1 Tax=Plakobranchus ocellatus TaxID=259542 RepID=A0AAV4BAC6_9GAST|nr:organic cation transporter protein [Plakobranchus ocellatus]